MNEVGDRSIAPQDERVELGDTQEPAAPLEQADDQTRGRTWLMRMAAVVAPATPTSCQNGNGSGASGLVLDATSATEPPMASGGISLQDATRLLTQATFGLRSNRDAMEVFLEGAEHWLWRQFNANAESHVAYLDKRREKDPQTGQLQDAYENHSYEAVWRQWLFDDAGQLRARMAFALSQIFVISNIAPDIRPYAMSSYMDMLNRNAFGNFRTLLKDVTVHPAMGYYLNMLESAKEDPKTGTHPNENYAREVLQLFSIGMVKLRDDGSVLLDAQNKPVPTYDEDVVKGFARAFSGWSFGGQSPTRNLTMDDLFEYSDYNDNRNWTTPLRAYATFHEPGSKKLLDGVTLPAGQTPEKDLEDALDNIFNHPNVPPFICKQLIQRLVTSNPTPQYVSDVVAVFKNNGKGVRGDLKAVVRAILVHAQARGDDALQRDSYGKLREPVIRFANMLRALDVKARDAMGSSSFWALFSEEMPLGQHPLLAPSVFNFYSPAFRIPGGANKAPVVAPEFQITNETTMVSSYNMFYDLVYGWDDNYDVKLDFASWQALARQPEALVDRINVTLCCQQMTAVTRQRLLTMLKSMKAYSDWDDRQRVGAALMLTAVSPDFVIQK